MIKKLHRRWRSARRAKAFHRRTFHALNALDDHTLTDIGLCRADLPAVASKISRSSADRGTGE